MIALDTSSLIAYLSGQRGKDVSAVELTLEQKQGVLPPVVLSELLSDPKLPDTVVHLFKMLPLLQPTEGFWERAGFLRAKLIAKGRKARLADSLITQSCLDHGVALITRDADFKHFARLGGLELFV